MADFKNVFYFTSGTGQWTEVFYTQAEGPAAAFALITPQYMNARMKLANPITQCIKCRISQVGNPRSSEILGFSNAVGGDGPLQVGGVSAQPYPNTVALVATLAGTIGGRVYTRKWWCRGISIGTANRNSTNGNLQVNPNWQTAFNTWARQAANAKMEVLPITPVGVANVTYYTATLVSPGAAPGQTAITLPGLANIVAGDRVIISLFSKKDLPGLNGTYTALAVTPAVGATAGILFIPYQMPTTTAYEPNKGRIKLQVLQTGVTFSASIAALQFLGERKTKNVATGSLGKKRATSIRLLS